MAEDHETYAKALNAYTAKQQEIYRLAECARNNPDSQPEFRKAFAELHRLYDAVKLRTPADKPYPAYPSYEQ